MPDKNNTSLAKTPLFTRFLQILERCTILPFSLSQQIIENIGVFVAGKSDGAFLTNTAFLQGSYYFCIA